MSMSTETARERQEKNILVRCARCESEAIPEGLYCTKCGYIPVWRDGNGEPL